MIAVGHLCMLFLSRQFIDVAVSRFLSKKYDHLDNRRLFSEYVELWSTCACWLRYYTGRFGCENLNEGEFNRTHSCFLPNYENSVKGSWRNNIYIVVHVYVILYRFFDSIFLMLFYPKSGTFVIFATMCVCVCVCKVLFFVDYSLFLCRYLV